MPVNLVSKQKIKIFIAGAYGMVGSAIVRAYEKVNLEGEESYELLIPKKTDLDLTNFWEVENWFKKNKPQFVIIAAAKVGGIYANLTYPYDFILNNLKIQTNIIEISNKYKVKKLLFLGSSCIYPRLSPQPISEEYLLKGDLEKTNEYYAIAKITGIKLCQSLHKQKGLNAISLMPTNLFGPGDNYNPTQSHVLAAFIHKFVDAKKRKLKEVTCWGTGKPMREFLFVDDLAEACIFVMRNWSLDDTSAPRDDNGEILYWLNVGSEEEISIKDLAKKVANMVQFEGRILWDISKPDGTPRKKLNNSRINKLGWNATTSLNSGIFKTIKAYEEEIEKNILRF